MNLRPVWVALLAVAALFWTGQGESANPILSAMELPLNIVSDCRDDCAGNPRPFTIHWLGRTERGNLYVVTRARCEDDACGAWVVEKTRRGVGTLLSIEGRFKLVHRDLPFPDVQVEKDLSEVEAAFARYEWRGGAYVLAEDKHIYRVDGVECGTADQCNQTALDAMRNRHAGHAVRIWETVHKISWI